MREIKFRAWDKKNNYMDDDFFIHADNGYYDYAIRTYDTPNIEIEKAENDMFELMQYTGLKDKNGKEIYEGDILKRTLLPTRRIANISTVKWISFKSCFSSVDIDGSSVTFISDYINSNYELEVIGNIYENPELLKESEE